MLDSLLAGESAPRTAELVESMLRQTPQLVARSVEWRLEQGTLVLSGRVMSFYQKQLAQMAACRLPGIDRVVNELEVDHRATRHTLLPHDKD
jgi:osmotically-inducible protein OsmY